MRPGVAKPARGRWAPTSVDVVLPGRRGERSFTTWKCGGCGFRAVTKDGEDPGKCLNRKCPAYGGD